jgi:hypothetical protein
MAVEAHQRALMTEFQSNHSNWSIPIEHLKGSIRIEHLKGSIRIEHPNRGITIEAFAVRYSIRIRESQSHRQRHWANV